MNAELVLMGKRVDMAQRIHRRTLVVFIYGALAALMTVLFFLDHWRVSGAMLAWIPGPAIDLLTYGLVLAAIVVALTLPQAILLWTEPDMEREVQ